MNIIFFWLIGHIVERLRFFQQKTPKPNSLLPRSFDIETVTRQYGYQFKGLRE